MVTSLSVLPVVHGKQVGDPLSSAQVSITTLVYSLVVVAIVF